MCVLCVKGQWDCGDYVVVGYDLWYVYEIGQFQQDFVVQVQFLDVLFVDVLVVVFLCYCQVICCEELIECDVVMDCWMVCFGECGERVVEQGFIVQVWVGECWEIVDGKIYCFVFQCIFEVFDGNCEVVQMGMWCLFFECVQQWGDEDWYVEIGGCYGEDVFVLFGCEVLLVQDIVVDDGQCLCDGCGDVFGERGGVYFVFGFDEQIVVEEYVKFGQVGVGGGLVYFQLVCDC